MSDQDMSSVSVTLRPNSITSIHAWAIGDRQPWLTIETGHVRVNLTTDHGDTAVSSLRAVLEAALTALDEFAGTPRREGEEQTVVSVPWPPEPVQAPEGDDA
jgi:hypothetical protein